MCRIELMLGRYPFLATTEFGALRRIALLSSMEAHMIGHTFVDGAFIASLLRSLPGVLFAGLVLVSGAAIIGLISFLIKYAAAK
jgi:hypothetical protein